MNFREKWRSREKTVRFVLGCIRRLYEAPSRGAATKRAKLSDDFESDVGGGQSIHVYFTSWKS